MITGITIVSVWVLDQDSAKEFYAGKLGFTVTNDLKLDNGMRMRDDSGNWFSFTQRTS